MMSWPLGTVPGRLPGDPVADDRANIIELIHRMLSQFNTDSKFCDWPNDITKGRSQWVLIRYQASHRDCRYAFTTGDVYKWYNAKRTR